MLPKKPGGDGRRPVLAGRIIRELRWPDKGVAQDCPIFVGFMLQCDLCEPLERERQTMPRLFARSCGGFHSNLSPQGL